MELKPPDKIKETFQVTNCTVTEDQEVERPIISVSLPIVVLGAVTPAPDPSSSEDKVAAVIKRVACDTPKTDSATLIRFKEFVGKFLKENLTPISENDDVSFDSWIQGTEYSRKRKRQLISLWRRLEPVVDECENRMTDVESFTKDEHYLLWKFLRTINSRTDFFKCYSGPLFNIISKKLFCLKWFIKNVPVSERPELLMRTLYQENQEYICTDYTSFESHFRKEIMDVCENQLYRYMCSGMQDASQRMERIIGVLTGNNTVKFNTFSYHIEATRMSGEMCTSLGNGFSNLMLFLFACHENNCGRVDGFVEGDDGVFTVQHKDRRPTVEQFASMGWTIKMEIHDQLSRASFCGNVFEPGPNHVVTDIRKQLVNFGWTSRRYVNANNNTKLQLLRAKAFSLVYQFNGCPILALFGRHLLKLTDHVTIRESIINNMGVYKAEEYKRNASTELPDYIEPHPATRHLVEEMYGITVSQQLNFEKFIPTIKLDTAIPVNFDVPHDWIDYANNYVAPADRAWVPPGGSPNRTKKYLMQFGAQTRVFTESYYRS
jgi:hypothetical protein